MPSRATVQAFIALVERGEYVKAIEDFYHPDASMQENGLPPRVGRQTLVEHEKAVLAGLAAMRTRRVETFLVDGDRVVINWVFEMTGPDGSMRVLRRACAAGLGRRPHPPRALLLRPGPAPPAAGVTRSSGCRLWRYQRSH